MTITPKDDDKFLSEMIAALVRRFSVGEIAAELSVIAAQRSAFASEWHDAEERLEEIAEDLQELEERALFAVFESSHINR